MVSEAIRTDGESSAGAVVVGGLEPVGSATQPVVVARAAALAVNSRRREIGWRATDGSIGVSDKCLVLGKTSVCV